MIEQVRVKGASKNSFMPTRPRITCDQPGCKCHLDGNAGSGDESIKERAMSMGWTTDPDTGKHCCPCDDCREKAGVSDDDDQGNMMPKSYRSSNGRSGKAAA